MRLLAASRATMILSGARRRAAREGLGHRAGVDQPGARARSARPPVLRLGHDDRAGQRPGRARARPEGRPAARLPDARRPRRPRARRRRLGRRPRRAPAARASRPTRCSTALGTDGGVRALLVMASNVAVSAPRAAHVRERLARARLPRASPTSSSPRPPSSPTSSCPATQWAEEDGHDDQPRGPRAAAPPRGRGPRRACAATSRSSPSSPTASGRGALLRPRARARCSTSCAAPARAGTADYAGISYERIEAERGVFWPCPVRGRTRARRACSGTASRPRTAGRASTSCTTATPPSRPTTSTRTA